jgi:hypothetical protein
MGRCGFLSSDKRKEMAHAETRREAQLGGSPRLRVKAVLLFEGGTSSAPRVRLVLADRALPRYFFFADFFEALDFEDDFFAELFFAGDFAADFLDVLFVLDAFFDEAFADDFFEDDFFADDERFTSPLSPCPGFAAVFDLLRRSAASDRPTSTTSLNFPS